MQYISIFAFTVRGGFVNSKNLILSWYQRNFYHEKCIYPYYIRPFPFAFLLTYHGAVLLCFYFLDTFALKS